MTLDPPKAKPKRSRVKKDRPVEEFAVRPPHAPPVVAEAKGMETARQAAEAVGLTLQELADLLVDNGVTTLPPADGITEKYTLEDLGKKLVGQLATELPSRRAGWFARLSDSQQTAVICHLRNKQYSSEAIGRDFQIHPSIVVRKWNEYAADLGAQVVGIRLDTIAGQLQLISERAQEMASLAGDHNAVWRIQKELVQALQSIGIVDRAIHRVEVTHRMGDDQKDEITRLVQLEQKKLLRIEEIKQIDISEAKTDKLPDEVLNRDPDDE